MKTKCVLVARHEGAAHEIKEHEFACLHDADQAIRDMAYTAPQAGAGYHKFSVGIWVDPPIGENDLLWTSRIDIDASHSTYFSLKDRLIAIYSGYGDQEPFKQILLMVKGMSETDYVPSGISIHTLLKKLYAAIEYRAGRYWLNSTDPVLHRMMDREFVPDIYSEISMVLGVIVRASDHIWEEQDYIDQMAALLNPVFAQIDDNFCSIRVTQSSYYQNMMSVKTPETVGQAKDIYSGVCCDIYRQLINAAQLEISG